MLGGGGIILVDGRLQAAGVEILAGPRLAVLLGQLDPRAHEERGDGLRACVDEVFLASALGAAAEDGRGVVVLGVDL